MSNGRADGQTTTVNAGADLRIAVLAFGVIFLDQLTKYVVLKLLGFGDERVVLHGFFKFVHLGNTGAAWSMFSGNNGTLAVVAIVALIVLFAGRRHFEAHRPGGQISLGLIFGGIVGNLIDRLLPSRHHVIDFLNFYVVRRDGSEAHFPAFNLADSAICVGVALLFLLSWQNSSSQAAPVSSGG